jgi:Reverse transcriptase (RNA-dependent DNA polymerase)
MKELQQMLTLKIIKPVHIASLSVDQRRSVIRSSMFLKAKYFLDGTFDKLKARLVAGGDQQDKSLYEELSSATVSMSSVFTLAAMAAYEKRTVAVVDIAGAFLNPDMSQGIPVHMRIDRTMTDFLITLDPSYSRYRDDRGGLTVKLEKALYGCVESSSLWYNNLRATLKDLGYKRNEIEVGVFNRRDSDGVQCTATVHVDDLLIISTSTDMIEKLTDGLKKRYGAITLNRAPIVNYFGMVLDFSHTGEARVTMGGYIDELFKTSGVQGVARTPGTDGLFEVRGSAQPVPERVRVWFHSLIATILCLAKRTKPECLVAVSVLASKVNNCDSDDIDKAIRLVRYIRGSKDTGFVLRPGVIGCG